MTGQEKIHDISKKDLMEHGQWLSMLGWITKENKEKDKKEKNWEGQLKTRWKFHKERKDYDHKDYVTL